MNNKSIGLYVCWHNKCPSFDNELLYAVNDGIIEGDNISSKGLHYGELKVTYWIWKNAKEDIVGLFHYRRFLNLLNNEAMCNKVSKDFASRYGFTRGRIIELMGKYDVILPYKNPRIVKETHPSVYDYYAMEHFKDDLDITLEILQEKYPQMYDTAIEMLKNSKQGYVANLIIAKKEIFDRYASWLFDILFEVEKRIHDKVILRDQYQQRVYGFISERLMAVFFEYLAKNEDINILEAPMLFLEEDKWKFFKYYLKKINRKILTLIGFGRKEWNLYVK